MNNINLNNLSFEQLTSLKNQVNSLWDDQYKDCIEEVKIHKLKKEEYLYTYNDNHYLATKLPNGYIRIFSAKPYGKGYKRSEIIKSEFPFGFLQVRKAIRFNNFSN